MSSQAVPKNRLVAFPQTEEITLTPALWLAAGVISYNVALLAQKPMRVLAPSELPQQPPARAAALFRGVALAIEAATLPPSIRTAVLQISRTLLAPLNISVSLHGQNAARLFYLVEWHGGPELLTHDFPQKPVPPSPVETEPETPAIPDPTDHVGTDAFVRPANPERSGRGAPEAQNGERPEK